MADIDSKSKQNYKQSLKNTSLLGGVQIFTILVTIIRSKFIAVLLGVEGMGINGLFLSTTNTITAFTNLGLSTSAVRNIAQANATNDNSKISKVISIFRKLVWITGLLGLSVCLLFAPYLSRITFGNSHYAFSFVLLSITLLFNQLNAGQVALLQGMRKFTWMAKASLYGAILGLVFSVPLYYFFYIKGVVIVIILASGTSLLLSWMYSKRIKVEKNSISLVVAIKEGKGMIKMGFFLGLQSALSLLSGYLIRIFIGHTGGMLEVGLYVAGFTIVNTYVGLIFNAMGTEYYPRLSTFADQKSLFNQAINQQMEICILLLSPIVVGFIIFADFGIALLYSKEFLAINSMLYFTILGMFFRAPSWSIALSFLAKGDSNVFLVNEICALIYTTVSNILFYKYMGLLGMGVSFLITYFIYWIQVYIVTSRKYELKIDVNFWKIYFPLFTISVLGVILTLMCSDLIKYVIGLFLLFLSSFISFYYLNKRVDVLSWLKKINKNK